MRELHTTYKDDDLVIIGVHTPEFSPEKNIDNVQAAITRLNIPYPVVLDNQRQTWRAYNNRYWPAQYIIDKAGHIREFHIGEFHIDDTRYTNTKKIIEALLAENIF